MLALRAALVAACLLLFVRVLARSDLAAAWTRIRGMGPEALLVLVPFPFGLLCDAAAWKRLLAALGRRARLRTLFGIRLITEAVNNTTPAGPVWSEAAAPVLVARRCGIEVADAFAASTAKRWLIVRMHGAYVALAVALGATSLAAASTALLGGRHGLPIVVLASALGLVLFSLGIEWLAARGGIAERTSGMLGRWSRVRAWIEEHRRHFLLADAQLRRLSDDRRAAVSSAARVMMVWLAEGFETWLILHLLGANLDYAAVISFDAALSIVRSAAVFAPAGIGVQDAGYLAVLEAYGVPNADAIGPAFVVVKRAKEALFIAIGLAMFVRLGMKRRQGLAQGEPAATQT
ncbi:MAG TPA: flippase-like domain-containing protein [Labilithrix sp.]